MLLRKVTLGSRNNCTKVHYRGGRKRGTVVKVFQRGYQRNLIGFSKKVERCQMPL